MGGYCYKNTAQVMCVMKELFPDVVVETGTYVHDKTAQDSTHTETGEYN